MVNTVQLFTKEEENMELNPAYAYYPDPTKGARYIDKEDGIPVTLHNTSRFCYACNGTSTSGLRISKDGTVLHSLYNIGVEGFKVIATNYPEYFSKEGILELKGTIPTQEEGKESDSSLCRKCGGDVDLTNEDAGTDREIQRLCNPCFYSPSLVGDKEQEERMFSLNEMNDCWDAAMEYLYAERDRVWGGVNTVPNKEQYINSLTQ